MERSSSTINTCIGCVVFTVQFLSTLLSPLGEPARQVDNLIVFLTQTARTPHRKKPMRHSHLLTWECLCRRTIHAVITRCSHLAHTAGPYNWSILLILWIGCMLQPAHPPALPPAPSSGTRNGAVYRLLSFVRGNCEKTARSVSVAYAMLRKVQALSPVPRLSWHALHDQNGY